MIVNTADLCDAHEPSVSVAEPLFQDFGGIESFHGKIATVRCFEDNSLVREALRSPGARQVLVVDGGGSRRRALVGDLLAQAGADNQWAGIIVFGCIRDSHVISTIQIGCKALATIPLKTEKKGAGEKDIPVRFASVDFIPGHFLYADKDGIIVSEKSLIADS
ncbi:MAG: ribonuclease E activity regulator RraA [Gammaproteobacteria bacterium]|nr:ribonuclease E activity regulator RraA [Gammaproteobacteria bacterium]